MNKFLLTAILSSFMVASVYAGPSASYSYLKDRGARVYVDTLRWSNNHGIGTGGLVDTLKAAADVDTTTEIQLSNLEALSAFFSVKGAQGTAGGTHTTSCSLEVSLDGTNFMTVTGTPIYTLSSSPGATASKAFRVYYAVDGDSAVTATDIPGPRTRMVIQGSRLGRFKCAQASGAADTSFVTLVVYRSYKPFTP